MPIYLQIEGIEGDATQADHRNWMTIETLHWNVSRNINTTTGATRNRETSEPTVAEVLVTKISDSSSTKLFQEAATGQFGKRAVIHIVTTGDPGYTYTEYVLSNTLISSYSVDTSGDRPIETLRLNFTKIDFKYTPLDENNRPLTPMMGGYDLATGKTF